MLGCLDQATSHRLPGLAPVRKERYILFSYLFILIVSLIYLFIYLFMVYLRDLSVVQ